jgi:hypothetical protein
MSDFQNQVGMVAPAGAAGDSASTNPDIVVVNPISGAWKAAGGGVQAVLAFRRWVLLLKTSKVHYPRVLKPQWLSLAALV